VSWSSFSDARGGGGNVVLWRSNGGTVEETQTTWTLQGRTVLLDMEKGESLMLQYSDNNNYGINKLTLCISLVHAYDIKATKGAEAPALRVMPESDSPPGHEMEYRLKLKGTNDHLENSVATHFKLNHQNSSVACQDNTPRKCKSSCKSTSMKKCDPGCSFDYNTLGSCKDRPYGYGHGIDNTTNNPCFFLYFDPENFWDPGYKGASRDRYIPGDRVPYSYDELQITCDAKIITEELDLYTQFQDMAKNLLEGPTPQIVLEAVQNFTRNRALFDELANLGDEIYELSEAMYPLQSYIAETEIQKLMGKLNRSMDQIDEGHLKELTKEYLKNDDITQLKFKSVFSWWKQFHKLDEIQQKSILQNLEVYAENIDTNDNDESKSAKLRHIVCEDSKGGYCELAEIIIDMDEDWRLPGKQQLSKFLDSLTIIENLDTEDIETSLSDILTKIKEEQAWTKDEYKRLQIISDDRKAVNFVKYFKDNVFWAFLEVKQQILVHKDKKERIKTTFFPETQTIPKKYFPVNGDEENPYVAVKLHLQDKSGLMPGQEISVQCKAWYKDVVHEGETGKGMLKFKIKLL